ncbi:hypothetical protein C1I60_20885 [Paenibacillus terrae]|uniref:Uncharacterized protein n=1 Tax=Paenibacillus terrae TaxID=159743 RepID=A0A4V5SQ26_9BACL|nr:hypothetical protein [Paenibacillus terrae]TKH41771.1 hypothetical protein C1I60_20885 [Paenibacillus terrae]
MLRLSPFWVYTLKRRKYEFNRIYVFFVNTPGEAWLQASEAYLPTQLSSQGEIFFMTVQQRSGGFESGEAIAFAFVMGF